AMPRPIMPKPMNPIFSDCSLMICLFSEGLTVAAFYPGAGDVQGWAAGRDEGGPVASAGTWHALFFQQNNCPTAEFEKSARLPPICLRELRLTAAPRMVRSPVTYGFSSSC